MAGARTAIRLDKWLWQARFCKTRGAGGAADRRGRGAGQRGAG